MKLIYSAINKPRRNIYTKYYGSHLRTLRYNTQDIIDNSIDPVIGVVWERIVRRVAGRDY